MLIPNLFDNFKDCVPTKGILHIGANKCEELDYYNTINFYNDRILWIEAIPETVETVKLKDPTINIIQSVISNKDDEEVNFMITNNKASSSILSLKTHLSEYPYIYEEERKTMKTITLNSLYDNYNIPYDRYDFINIDIQGAELMALQGASKILPHIKAVYCEVNLAELYENCALLPEIDSLLSTYDFRRVELHMSCHGWGDALYIKNN